MNEDYLLTYDGSTARQYVLDSGWEIASWWRHVEHVGNVVRVTVADPEADEDDFVDGPTVIFDITPVILQAAIYAVLGAAPSTQDFLDIDAAVGDAIVQVACFGEVVYN